MHVLCNIINIQYNLICIYIIICTTYNLRHIVPLEHLTLFFCAYIIYSSDAMSSHSQAYLIIQCTRSLVAYRLLNICYYYKLMNPDNLILDLHMINNLSKYVTLW